MPKYTDYRNDKVDTPPPGPSTTMGGDYFYDKTDKRDKTEYRRRYKKTEKRTHKKKRYGGRKKTHKRTEKRHRRNKHRR